MEIKQLQLEILEAERLIERNKLIINMYLKMQAIKEETPSAD